MTWTLRAAYSNSIRFQGDCRGLADDLVRDVCDAVGDGKASSRKDYEAELARGSGRAGAGARFQLCTSTCLSKVSLPEASTAVVAATSNGFSLEAARECFSGGELPQLGRPDSPAEAVIAGVTGGPSAAPAKRQTPQAEESSTRASASRPPLLGWPSLLVLL